MSNQFTENSKNIIVRGEVHDNVLKSQRPYPTNVNTLIGGQSPEYILAKKMANVKRNAIAEGMSPGEAFAYAGRLKGGNRK